MRLVKGFKVSALVAIAVPALLALTAITTLADASPANTALPGDPTRGATLYLQNCTSCHGVNLEGGIGAVLNPIDKLPGVANPLDAPSSSTSSRTAASLNRVTPSRLRCRRWAATPT